MKAGTGTFVDIWVIYPSDEDRGMWVAHSLNTDQLALGRSKLEAYVELKRVIKALLDAAETDPSLRVMSPAPREIKNMLKTAARMPQELLDRAEELLARNERQPSDKKPAQTPPIDLELIQHAT